MEAWLRNLKAYRATELAAMASEAALSQVVLVAGESVAAAVVGTSLTACSS